MSKSQAPWPAEVRDARDRIRREIISTTQRLHATCPASVVEWWLAEMQHAVDSAEEMLWGNAVPEVRTLPPRDFDIPEEMHDEPTP